MVCSHNRAGVAPGSAAQSRGDGVGSGSSRRKPSQRSMTPGAYRPAARGGLSCMRRLNAYGEPPEPRLWAFKKARLPNLFSGAVADQAPQRRSGAVKEALHPGAFATGVVISARCFACNRWWPGEARAALFDHEIAALITSLQLPVEP